MMQPTILLFASQQVVVVSSSYYYLLLIGVVVVDRKEGKGGNVKTTNLTIHIYLEGDVVLYTYVVLSFTDQSFFLASLLLLVGWPIKKQCNFTI
jgi:hypothetical protein